MRKYKIVIHKKDLKELKSAYKFKCKIIFYGLLFAYIADFLVKVYLIWKVGGVSIAFLGAVIDFGAKTFHLKNTKFRREVILKLPIR